MVKMAYALPVKLLSINATNMCPNNASKTTLSEVLQSDPVKRLFNQPNIVIKTVPLNSMTEIFGNRNDMNAELNNIKPPEISIVPIKIPDEEKEDANLLPSKIEDKKSEITLLPVKRKLCGHYEPCENIICDVTVQQYVDKDRVSPILAVNIEEGEINAPVAKHCKNKYCDALSIDHNRCRRALIKLHKCDRSCICDICGITLMGWKSRMHHKNCMKKDEYRHNNVNRVDLLRERMRERELQILEMAKMKKNDYSDPIKAMETLRKNEELIIIPKTAPNQQPIITITSIPSTQSAGNNLTNILGNIPFTVSSQNAAIPGNTSCIVKSKTQSIQQVKFSNLQQKSYMTSASASVSDSATTSTSTIASTTTSASIVTPVSSSVQIVPTQNKNVRLTNSETTTVQSLTINNLVVSPSQILTTARTIQLNPSLLTPIRVMPITNLITAPSLLHRTQGVPKFCIMTVPNPLPVPSLAAVTPKTIPKIIVRQEDTSKVSIQHNSVQKMHKTPKKLLKRKKSFFCVYCSKNFTTDWYFKMHVAKHKGVKLFFCNLCDESFSNKYDMKKHSTKQHNGKTAYAYDKSNNVSTSPTFLKMHMTSNFNKADVKSTNRKQDFSKDQVDSNEMHKKIKCEDIPSSPSEKKDISINGKMIQEHDNKKLSTINRDNITKKLSCVSVEDIDPDNFEQKAVVASG